MRFFGIVDERFRAEARPPANLSRDQRERRAKLDARPSRRDGSDPLLFPVPRGKTEDPDGGRRFTRTPTPSPLTNALNEMREAVQAMLDEKDDG